MKFRFRGGGAAKGGGNVVLEGTTAEGFTGLGVEVRLAGDKSDVFKDCALVLGVTEYGLCVKRKGGCRARSGKFEV